ncbi:MAG TPA: carboxypeptidase-like regulatory domain-containing protein, partial [Candidatus Nanoarchaeia archaeon]|nr:carboxypeptidase-like regulatory domain-containing protein [Candidatus Nanoarchaeia archaeon]
MKVTTYLLLLLLVPFVSAENAAIKGIVFDRLDNVVGFAEIKLDCLEQTFAADKFGTFSIKDVPPGPCRIHAAFRDGTGFQLITIEPNQTMYIELKLDKTIVNIPKEGNYLLPVVLAIAVLLLVLYFVLRKKKVVEEKKVEA